MSTVSLAAGPHLASAHDPGLSSAVVRVESASLIAQLVVASKDISSLVPFDQDEDGRMGDDELRRSASDLQRLARGMLELAVAEVPLGAPRVRLSVVEAGSELIIRLEYPLPAASADAAATPSIRIRSAILGKMAHGHRQTLRIIDERGRLLGSQILHRGNDSLVTTDRQFAASQPG